MPFLNRNTSTKQYFNTSFTDKQLDTIDQIISEYIQNELVPFDFNDIILIFDSRVIISHSGYFMGKTFRLFKNYDNYIFESLNEEYSEFDRFEDQSFDDLIRHLKDTFESDIEVFETNNNN